MARRSLEDCRALLTGASSGIGRALAVSLAKRKVRLLLTAQSRKALQQVCDECLAAGGAAEILPGDVTSGEHRRAFVEWARDAWGGLDLLVNNAGVSAHGEFVDSDEATLRRVMEVNFFAAAELTRLTLPLLAEGRRPAVVNIGSIIGHRGLPFNSEYAASKFALRGWSESLRAELAGRGIDVLMVSPGTTDTAFFEHLVAKRGDMPWGKSTAVSAEVVARQTVRALERRKLEIYPNWRGRLLVLANRLAPRLVDRAMARMARRRDVSETRES